jgi:hypothetical protein
MDFALRLAVVLSDAGAAWTRMPLSMGRMVSTWLDASRFWQEEGIYLKLAFQLTDQDADPSLSVVDAQVMAIPDYFAAAGSPTRSLPPGGRFLPRKPMGLDA